MHRVINKGFLCFLYVLFACNTAQVKNNTYKIPINDLSSSRTDFLSAIETNGKTYLYFKNQMQNTIDVFDLLAGEKVSSLYLSRHKSSSSEIQSVNYVNNDTLLALVKNTPVLYFFNQYGHMYSQWNLPAKELIHFSTSANPPVVYKNKIYISLLDNQLSNPLVNPSKFKAYEYSIDLKTKKTRLIKNVLSDTTSMLYGLRHRIATRAFANGKLYYVWGGCKKALMYDLDRSASKTIDLPIKNLNLKPFTGEYTHNKNQQHYYFNNIVIDHLKFNKYKKVFYLFVLSPHITARHKYQRDFTIVVLDEQLNYITKKIFDTQKYLYDQAIITKDGLFLATNNPFSPIQQKGTLEFKRINFD